MPHVPLRDGRRLRVEVAGSGPALLLVHGFSGSRLAWPPPIVSAMSADFRVVCVDLLGHGDSALCGEPQRFALAELVEDLCEVLDVLSARRAIWAGYSMGGRICLAAAVLNPTRVSALVLEGASPGLAEPEEREARRASDEALASRLEREGLARFVDQWMAQPLFASQSRLDPAVLAAERQRRMSGDSASLAACLRGAGTGAQPSFWDRLGDVSAPALLLTGALDGKFTELARRMGCALPAATTRIADRCGHAVHLEDPKAWLEAVLPFARRICAEGVLA